MTEERSHLREKVWLLEGVLATARREIEALRGDHRDFQQEIGTLNQIVGMRDAEIEVLTRERDNALLRAEELEQTLGRYISEWGGDRGGVHPNA